MMNSRIKPLHSILDPFIIGLIASIATAYLMPNIGMSGALPIKLQDFTHYATILIFFFYGLKLNKEKIKQGLHNWPMHLSIQTITFFLFPILVLPTYALTDASTKTLWIGIFFLATLPSTVSSSVVMVSLAKGNVTAAIFNASLSGLVGIVLTPLWMSLFLESTGGAYNWEHTALQLVYQLLLPVAAGLLVQKYWGTWATKHKNKLATFDKVIILLIVYQSFSKSFTSGELSSIGIANISIIAISSISLFFIVFFISKGVAKWLKFSREDCITLIFCASKKSLIHGTVMSSVLFATTNKASLILLPIMIYHAFQLIYTSWLAQRLSQEVVDDEVDG